MVDILQNYFWKKYKDYVKAMGLMLQQNEPDDYVIASGETHSVREFIEYAFKYVGINIVWKNQGIEEVGINKNTGEILVMVDSNLFRPAEVDVLLGNPNKAKSKLGWSSNVEFKENPMFDICVTKYQCATLIHKIYTANTH